METKTGNLLLTMNDQAGLTRVKLIPASMRAAAEADGVSQSLTTTMLLAADDSIADLPGYRIATGDIRLHPDLDAARVIDAASGRVWAPADQRTPDGEPFAVCQRTILRRQADRMRGLGVDPVAGFEVEFAVYRPHGDGWLLADTTAAYGVESLLGSLSWVEELIDVCEAAGLSIRQVHPEWGKGQYEFALGARDPLRACDDYVLSRILITIVLARHGLRPSFSPKPEIAAAGNGAHIHLSGTTADGGNIFAGPESFTDLGGRWIAALVDHLPNTIALFAGGPHSYARLQPGAFAGAVSCWGIENREAAVRCIPGPAGARDAAANIEVKVPDGTCNPYLAMAALLALGSHGFDSEPTIPEPLAVPPSAASAAELAAARAVPFAGSLADALDLLRDERVLHEALGPDAIETYAGIRSLVAAETLDDALFDSYRWQQ